MFPSFLSFLISFIILGVYWVGHHAQFQYIRAADQNLLWLNITFLMAISVVPFSAALLGLHGDEQIAVIIYAANLIVVSLAHYATWRYATRCTRLVPDDIDPAIVALNNRLSLTPVAMYVMAIILSFISPYLSIALYVLVPVWFIGGRIYEAIHRDRLAKIRHRNND